ncbi:MAG: (d)CMP kinase [Lachnospiraceae bacterium]
MTVAIAIDGPAGAGKSTIAKAVAKKLGFIYVDTGAMYRAMALFLIDQGVVPTDSASIAKVCEQADIEIRYTEGRQQVWLNGENVTERLRSEAVGEMASISSSNGKLREKLVRLQQQIASRDNVVMDGRDIGTKVLPQAQVKIYLTASVVTRASRRYEELRSREEPADLEAIQQSIQERDERDTNRVNSPLVQAADAVLVDSSDLSIEEVTETIIRIYQEAGQVL